MTVTRKLSIGAREFAVLDVGRMDYASALAMQRQWHDRILAQEVWGAVMLVEHEPVITISQRKTSGEHLIASRERLAQIGIDVQETDRGGDITYHGPGQLVAYPFLHLGDLKMHVGGYMRLLEQIVIDTLAVWNIQGHTETGATGVWVDDHSEDVILKTAGRAKICAMGVRVRRQVTMHGLALNVTTNLSHFETIVPCGLAGRKVTSMEQVMQHSQNHTALPLTMEHVKQAMLDAMVLRMKNILEV